MNFAKYIKRLNLRYSIQASNFSFRVALSTLSRFNEWQTPEGCNTGIKVYNSATREKVPLILQKIGIASWYMCGPTVYAEAHIGHASCYIKFDIIRRILEHIFDIDVVMLMGITDIDDKIIDKANKVGCTVKDIAKKYEQEFFEDLKYLNVQRPSIVARVTDFIPKIISFCEKLIEKDFAYVTAEGNVYFIISKVEPEGVNENIDPEFRPTIDPLKRDPRDFALWKAVKPGEPYWDSPWGAGRPGWHIECSTMASYVFGDKLDIHTGGSDLIFPHHSNEKLQSEAYHGNRQWVNYWLHSGLLHVEEEVKMSKSLGNTITIRDFLKEYPSDVLRIMCLQSPYHNSIQYSSKTLELAKAVYSKFHTFLNDSEAYLTNALYCQPFDDTELYKKFKESKETVRNSLCDDFNTSEALKCLVNLVSETNHFLQPTFENNGSVNLVVISAISSFIDRTLETFGVSILYKRKLPPIYVLFIDLIVQLRREIRAFALTGNFNEPTNKALPKLSSYPEDTKCSNTDLELILKSINNIQIKLSTLQKTCNSEIQSFNAIYSHFSIDYSSHFKSLVSVVSKFVNCVERHINSCGSDNKINERYLVRKQKKNIPVLKACDDLRTALYFQGIAIKDVKENSIWFPTAEIDMRRDGSIYDKAFK